MANVHTFRKSDVPGNDEAINRQDIVRSLHDALNGALRGIDQIPIFMREAFKHRVWECDRIFAGGTKQPPISFHEFVHLPYPVGLESTYDTVRRFLVTDAATLALWDKAVAGVRKQGARTDLVDNVHDVSTSRPAGNSSQSAIRRLRKASESGDAKAVDLLAKVEAGDVKPNRAAIEMGWRSKTITVVDDAEKILDEAIKRIGRVGCIEKIATGMTTAERDVIGETLTVKLVEDLKKKLKAANDAVEKARDKRSKIEGDLAVTQRMLADAREDRDRFRNDLSEAQSKIAYLERLHHAGR
ncbi:MULTISPECIES: hypothetical protein [Hyphomicrobiales]|uniref:hypothetical protein n=1 Tax=Hyphomicrobiales TaxID=356 RepID=UPI001BCDD4E8|nr:MULTISPECIES: hypothetical protein [Hyphomicrobiales]CAH1662741.1 hypothetical protein CHELA41_22261 [Hyphomicrobiales bacterium]MBS7741474.1 hypothetical protein [Chelatococcus sp. HY11]MBX3491215.1 hypothetical protein [Parvibaculum sp.]MBX3544507.1 hypothetical protein [Chelatococcus sp.]MCO5078970.1 hypothetical protein [Chelatococcus sp.]